MEESMALRPTARHDSGADLAIPELDPGYSIALSAAPNSPDSRNSRREPSFRLKRGKAA
jgi:hypothetical protein